MTKKPETEGAFAAMGRAADESLEIAMAIRGGRLTRPQFDAWYNRRRAEGRGLVITLREKTSDMTKPVETAIKQGEELLRAVPRARVRRSHRRVKAHARHRV